MNLFCMNLFSIQLSYKIFFLVILSSLIYYFHWDWTREINIWILVYSMISDKSFTRNISNSSYGHASRARNAPETISSTPNNFLCVRVSFSLQAHNFSLTQCACFDSICALLFATCNWVNIYFKLETKKSSGKKNLLSIFWESPNRIKTNNREMIF